MAGMDWKPGRRASPCRRRVQPIALENGMLAGALSTMTEHGASPRPSPIPEKLHIKL